MPSRSAAVRLTDLRRRVAALAAIVPLALVTAACPEPEESCASMCHAGEIAIGTPPNCDCKDPYAPEPPITQGPTPQRMRGNVHVVGLDGYTVEQVTARVSSVSVSATHVQVGRIASRPQAAVVLGPNLTAANFRIDAVDPVVQGILETPKPALNVRWSGPIRVLLRSPGGVLTPLEFDVPASRLPVRATRVGDATRIDGEMRLGPAQLSLVASLVPAVD